MTRHDPEYLDEVQKRMHRRHHPTVSSTGGFAATRKGYTAFLTKRPLAPFINWPLHEILFFLALLTLNVLLYIFEGLSRLTTWKRISKHFCILIQFNVAILLLLSTRNSIWSFFLGCSFDRSIQMHTITSFFLVISVLLHGITMLVYWVKEDIWKEEAVEFDNICGEAALVILIIVAIFSLPIVRRKIFETFRYLHLLGFVFMLLAMLHKDDMIVPIVLPMILYGIDLLLRIYSNSQKASISRSDMVTSDVARIELQKPRMLPAPGQFVFLCFPSISKTQWHPFSISGFDSFDEKEKDYFSVHIKDSGDYTHELCELIRADPRALESGGVFVEGPYGNIAIDVWSSYKTILIIAGGIGITPFLPVLRALSDLGLQDTNRKPVDVHLYWSVKSFALAQALEHEIDVPESNGFHLNVRLFVTQEEAPDEEMRTKSGVYEGWERGRVQLERVFHRLRERADDVGRSEAFAVLTCGPAGMMQEVGALCNKYSSTCGGTAFHLHCETFDL